MASPSFPRDLIGFSLIGLGAVLLAPWIWFGVWFRRIEQGLPYGFDLQGLMSGLQVLGLVSVLPIAAGVWLLLGNGGEDAKP